MSNVSWGSAESRYDWLNPLGSESGALKEDDAAVLADLSAAFQNANDSAARRSVLRSIVEKHPENEIALFASDFSSSLSYRPDAVDGFLMGVYAFAAARAKRIPKPTKEQTAATDAVSALCFDAFVFREQVPPVPSSLESKAYPPLGRAGGPLVDVFLWAWQGVRAGFGLPDAALSGLPTDFFKDPATYARLRVLAAESRKATGLEYAIRASTKRSSRIANRSRPEPPPPVETSSPGDPMAKLPPSSASFIESSNRRGASGKQKKKSSQNQKPVFQTKTQLLVTSVLNELTRQSSKPPTLKRLRRSVRSVFQSHHSSNAVLRKSVPLPRDVDSSVDLTLDVLKSIGMVVTSGSGEETTYAVDKEQDHALARIDEITERYLELLDETTSLEIEEYELKQQVPPTELLQKQRRVLDGLLRVRMASVRRISVERARAMQRVLGERQRIPSATGQTSSANHPSSPISASPTSVVAVASTGTSAQQSSAQYRVPVAARSGHEISARTRPIAFATVSQGFEPYTKSESALLASHVHDEHAAIVEPSDPNEVTSRVADDAASTAATMTMVYVPVVVKNDIRAEIDAAAESAKEVVLDEDSLLELHDASLKRAREEWEKHVEETKRLKKEARLHRQSSGMRSKSTSPRPTYIASPRMTFPTPASSKNQPHGKQ